MSGEISFYEQRTIKWDDSINGAVIIDQTSLPNKLEFVECKTVHDLIEAIKTLKIRGAPAIGVAGAMGIALSVHSSGATDREELIRKIRADATELKSARPTAVNLSWGVDRAFKYVEEGFSKNSSVSEIKTGVVEFVQKLADADVDTNKILGELGAKLFRNGESVLTHCN